LALALLAGLAGCGREAPPAKPPAPPASPAPPSGGALDGYRGKVLVLLLGAPGCPGTRAATEFLTGYLKAAPPEVAVLRLDVPVPGEKVSDTLTPKVSDTFSPPGAVSIPRKTDADRRVADKLGFFFYPTLYILDRDGAVRFSGGCEPARLREVVAALVAEKPGEAKRSFSPPLLEVGAAAPALAGKTPAGAELAPEKLRGAKATLLFFGATDCPFSNQGLAALPGLARDYGARGAAVAVVTRSPAGEATARLHDEQAPGVAVLCDPEDRVGRELYRVPAVPFYYALDAGGKVAARGPFTEAAARAALDRALGLAGSAEQRPASTGAG
jgi:thiol-disulfide isomerase/thioredoxin/peroxiredoxin